MRWPQKNYSAGDKTFLTISRLDKLDEPPALIQLNRRIRELIPPVDLTELLFEINARTCFTREFSHVSESGARAQDLNVSLYATLLADACNIAHEPLIKHNIPALTRHRLSWVKQNYLRAETPVSANARLSESVTDNVRLFYSTASAVFWPFVW